MKLGIPRVALCLCMAVHGCEAMVLRGSGAGRKADLAKILQHPAPKGTLDPLVADRLTRMLLMGNADPTAIEALRDQLEPMLESMENRVNASHNRDVELLNNDTVMLFDSCLNVNGSSDEVKYWETEYATENKSHAECVSEAAPEQDEVNNCTAEVETLENEEEDACPEHHEPKNDSVDMCVPTDNMQSREDWLAAMQDYFSKQLEDIDGVGGECGEAKEKLQNETNKCEEKKKKLEDKIDDCKNGEDAMTAMNCSLINAEDIMCKAYEACYAYASDWYGNFTDSTAQRVAERKSEWRLVQQLRCLFGTVNGTGVDQTMLDQCANAGTYPTDHLDMDYPAAPPKSACSETHPADIPDECTNGTDWKKGLVLPNGTEFNWTFPTPPVIPPYVVPEPCEV